MASASNSNSSSSSNSTSKEQQLFQAAESGDRSALQAVLRDAIIAKPHKLGHPVCGILTGISAVSGADYYKSVSAAYGELVARGKFMAHNPRIVLSSVDCADYAVLVVEGRWDEIGEYLADGVTPVAGCCDFLIIASNTGHMAVPDIQRRFPALPVLHIADATAAEIWRQARTSGRPTPKRITVGLLGTAATMEQAYLKDRLAAHGVDTIVPSSPSDRQRVFSAIMDELSIDEFKESTRAFFVQQVEALAARGAVGVVLGCTEIELLELESRVSVPLYRSAALHIQAAARVQAGLVDVHSLAPAQGAGGAPLQRRSRRRAVAVATLVAIAAAAVAAVWWR